MHSGAARVHSGTVTHTLVVATLMQYSAACSQVDLLHAQVHGRHAGQRVCHQHGQHQPDGHGGVAARLPLRGTG